MPINITNQGNANQNQEIAPHTHQNAIIKKTGNNKHWQRWGEKRTLVHSWWKCKLVEPLQKMMWRFLKNLKREAPYCSATALQGIYPKKRKTLIWKDVCTLVFIAALFLIAKTWKQLVHHWTNGLKNLKISLSFLLSLSHTHTHIHTMEYYSAVKNEILPFTATWTDPKGITLSEVWSEKDNVWSHLHKEF